MACEPRPVRRPGLIWLPLLLCACGTVQDPTPAATSGETTAAPTTRASRAAAEPPSPGPSPGDRHENVAGGWSIVVPTGWEIVAETGDGNAALSRNDAIAEILVGSSSDLSLEELEAQKVEEISRVWTGASGIESSLVHLPAGDAVRVIFETAGPPGTDTRGIFILYVIEEADTQYVISVRRTPAIDGLLADAEAIAESLAVFAPTPTAAPAPSECAVSETQPIGPNGVPAWGEAPLYVIGPMAGTNPGPRSVTLAFFRVGGSDEEFFISANDANRGQPLRLGHMDGGQPPSTLQFTLRLTSANAQDASPMGSGWVSWEVAMQLGPSGCYTVRATPANGDRDIRITVRFG